MILDVYFFLLFILGIIQSYILTTVPDLYKRIQDNLLKSIVNKKWDVYVEREDISIQYFNLISKLFLSIGILTPYWFIFLPTFILVFLGNYIQSKHKISPKKLNKTIFVSKLITYTIIIIKTITLIGMSVSYYHSLI